MGTYGFVCRERRGGELAATKRSEQHSGCHLRVGIENRSIDRKNERETKVGFIGRLDLPRGVGRV